MTITYHKELVQGSDEWIAQRCGLLTASEMRLILTPTLKIASNKDERAHLYELAAQRMTRYVEPHYISDDMLRGRDDEAEAKFKYEEAGYGHVEDCGFITNDKWGFTIGYSPDGLVDDDGLIEVKSRRQRFHLQTIIEGQMPDEYALQVQTGLLVSARAWCDFVSYCGGMPMFTLRVYPDLKVQGAIVDAAKAFHERMGEKIAIYTERLVDKNSRFVATERMTERDMYL